MDELQKCGIRLSHWIEHNKEHLKGYEDVAAILDQLGEKQVASLIREGIESVGVANARFQEALDSLSTGAAGAPTGHTHCGAHGHGHTHEHGHQHTHDHGHEHAHDHPQEHGHCHNHCPGHDHGHEHDHGEPHRHSHSHCHGKAGDKD